LKLQGIKNPTAERWKKIFFVVKKNAPGVARVETRKGMNIGDRCQEGKWHF
jgi:hypothetical protein